METTNKLLLVVMKFSVNMLRSLCLHNMFAGFIGNRHNNNDNRNMHYIYCTKNKIAKNTINDTKLSLAEFHSY